MTYCLIVMLLLYYVYLHDIKCHRSNFHSHQIVILLVFTALAGLRYRMAPDSITFEYEFNNIYPKIYNIHYSDITESRYPILWFLANSLFYTYFNYYIFQIFCAFISNYLVSKFINSVTTKYFSVMLFYFIFSFCYFNMDVMREFLAVSFEMYALAFILQNRNKIGIIFALLAPLIHSFSFFFSTLIFLIYLNVRKSVFAICSILGIILAINFSEAVSIIINYFPGMAVSVLYYTMMDIERISLLGFLSKLISPILLLIILKKANNANMSIFKSSNNYKRINDIAYLLVFSYLILVILRWSVPYAERLFNYYSLISYVIYAYGFYSLLCNRGSYTLYLFRLISLIILFYLPTAKEMFTKSEANVELFYRYYPYSNIINKEINIERERIIHNEQRVY